MSDNTNKGTAPVQEGPSQTQPEQGHPNETTEAFPPPPPGISIPPVDETSPPDDRIPQTSSPTNLRDFEGRRLYFANVCSTVSPQALHCIFRSYGPVRTFHYDTTLHYGYVVYMDREQALLARYGIDGLILGTRAIRVYYPPFKPRHPTRYCYNCREMGHYIQNCPYNQGNNWDYNYSHLYNQGQPVIDHMNHPSSPMMQHFAGHMIPPNSHIMFPAAPVATIPGQPPGAATLLYQPGWPQTSLANIPYIQPFIAPIHTPITSVHASMSPMPPHMNPMVQPHMHYHHHPVHPMQNPTHVPQPQIINHMPPLIPVSSVMPPHQLNPMQQLHPNINAIIQEQAAAIVQQQIGPMVQQLVSQIMQDPAINNLQQSMMQQQNMDPQSQRSGSYTVNEEPELESVQSGNMPMQHGSYTAMEEPRPAMPQAVLSQLMQNLPLQDSEYMGLGKMRHFRGQQLYRDYAQRNESSYQKESCSSRSRDVEVEEEVSPREQTEGAEPEDCCVANNSLLTNVTKPANTTAQHSTVTKTTTIHSGSNTTPRTQEYTSEQDFQTGTTSSAESTRLNTTEQPMQAAENPYYPQYPYQPPFSLPSSIFFTLPPIVVNITSPAPFMNPNGPIGEPRATFPPPYDAIPKNIPESFEFMPESEGNAQEFEEVARDEQNIGENEEDLHSEQSNVIPTEIPEPSVQPEVESSPRPKTPPKPSESKTQSGKKAGKVVKDKDQASGSGSSATVREKTPQMSERDRQRQDRLKLRAMLMDENEEASTVECEAIVPVESQEEGEPPGEKKVYTELISTMNTSCTEIETLFTNLSSLVGNPLAKKCLDQIRTKSEADILKLSQQLLHKIVDKDHPSDREEILKLSNDLLKYANEKSSEEPVCEEGAVGGVTVEETVESSRSECDSRKDDSDDGNYRRKNHWKKNKKRRR